MTLTTSQRAVLTWLRANGAEYSFTPPEIAHETGVRQVGATLRSLERRHLIYKYFDPGANNWRYYPSHRSE